MLEVAERLLCTIGHDVMEALFWTATEPKKPKYLVIPHLFFSIVYVSMFQNKTLKTLPWDLSHLGKFTNKPTKQL